LARKRHAVKKKVEESGVRLLGVLCPMRAEILTINQANVPSAASLTKQKKSKSGQNVTNHFTAVALTAARV
jgi:hypothetical protein